MFNLDRDVSVTLAPLADSRGDGCPGEVGLYVRDHVDGGNDSLTVVPNSGPFWTDLLLADFDRDGFDDVFQFHGSSLTGGGFAFLTAVDVDDPGKGLERATYRGMPSELVPVAGPAVAGDFNGDGAIDLAWLAAKPGDGSPVSIALLSVCPRAGATVLGTTCKDAFALVPSNTSQIGPRAIATDLRLEWPDLDCSGCPTSTYGFGLAAGNFDGRLAADSGFEKDELALVRSDIHAGTSTLWAYRFDASLKPDGGPKKTDVTSHVVPNQKLFLAGGRVNQFRAADQIAVVSGSFSNARLAVLQFDSDLTVHARSIDVLRDAFNSKLSKGGFPFPQGVTIGRFDPPTSGGTTEDFNSQIAALYEVNDTVNGRLSTVVQIYSLAEGSTAKPKLRSEHKLLDGRYLEGVLAHYAPLEAGDLRGRSLLLGEPSTFQVESHLQPSVLLGSPPQHVDYITPVRGERPVIFNFSALKKDFNSTYKVDVSSENQSSSKSTTSTGWSLSEKTKVEGKAVVGPVEVSGDLHQSLDVAEERTVGETFDTFSKKSFNASTATGFGDQVWYSSRRMNVYLYPVIGQYRCPMDLPDCSDDEKVQLVATFSGPDNVTSNISASGRTLEWYQPVHVPGQLLTYPWNREQLTLQAPELEALSQTDTGSFYTDDSSRTTNVSWSSGSTKSQSVGFSSSWKLGGGFSTTIGTPEATYKEAGGIKGSVGFDMAYSSGLKTLNTDSHKVGASSGISVRKPATFPSAASYQFLVTPYIFGSAPPPGQTQQLEPDADIETHGPLRTAFAADPTTNASGSWWSTGDYRRHLDLGFGFAARWEIVAKGTPGVKDADTACRGGECAVMDDPDTGELWNSSFYWLRGFYIRANGGGAQRSAVRSGDQVELSARVYNLSFVPMASTQRTRVRFYAQRWDPRTNDPYAGTTSFLVGEDLLGPIPAFAGGSEPNWRLARTTFDTGNCPGGCAGKYFVFWAVVWGEEANGTVIRDELPGHGLNRELTATQLDDLLSEDTPTIEAALAVGTADGGLLERTALTGGDETSFSNNVGYFHQVFYVHDREDSSALRASPEAQNAEAQGTGQGTVTLDAVQVEPERIAAGEEVVLTATLTATRTGNSGVQVLVWSHEPGGGEPTLLDHEAIGHVRSDQSYEISVPLRPGGCGRRSIEVRVDSGEPVGAGPARAQLEIEVDC